MHKITISLVLHTVDSYSHFQWKSRNKEIVVSFEEVKLHTGFELWWTHPSSTVNTLTYIFMTFTCSKPCLMDFLLNDCQMSAYKATLERIPAPLFWQQYWHWPFMFCVNSKMFSLSNFNVATIEISQRVLLSSQCLMIAFYNNNNISLNNKWA